MDGSRLSWEGISLVSVVLGFVGAALGVSYMPPMNKKQLLAALVAGVTCAALAPGATSEAIAWWRSTPAAPVLAVPLPAALNNVLAFVSGIGGMFLVPGLIVAFQSFKKNPFAVVDWARGRGAPPTPPSDGGQP